MGNLKRVRVSWTGSTVTGPATSTFYFNNTASGFPASLLTFWNSVANVLPTGTQITVPNSGDVIAEETGALQGVWTDTGGGSVSVGVGSSFVNGVGARIKWTTGVLISGQRIVGSTFIVPLRSDQYEGAGNIVAACLTTLNNAAAALITAQSGQFVIWARPTPKRPTGGHGNVVSGSAPDLVSWLRSRRT
jgi:hypothetical protein